MTARVRVNVENDKIKAGAVKNEFFFVARRTSQNIAENAAR